MDDDDHNTSNAFLLLCADALVGLVVLAGLTDLDELKVALGCRFALDVFTIIPQDHTVVDQEPVDLRPLACGLVLTSRAPAFSTEGRARASAWSSW